MDFARECCTRDNFIKSALREAGDGIFDEKKTKTTKIHRLEFIRICIYNWPRVIIASTFRLGIKIFVQKKKYIFLRESKKNTSSK